MNPSKRLLLGGIAFAGVLAAPLLDLGGSSAAAATNCIGGPGWSVNLTTPPILGCGAAAGGMTAGQVALGNLLANITQACANAQPATSPCASRRCTKIAQRCDVANATSKNLNVQLRPTMAGDPCATTDTTVAFVPQKMAGGNLKDVFFVCGCDCVGT